MTTVYYNFITSSIVKIPVSTTTVICDKATMLTHTQTTQLFKVTKLSQIKIFLNFTNSNSYPARSAKNCDVYVGSKVGVPNLMIF